MKRLVYSCIAILVVMQLSFCKKGIKPPIKPPSGHGEYTIGVYYYPGWKDLVTSWNPYPWNQIKTYTPEREPLLGWYKEGEVAVAEQHIQWMHDYGIDFVAYDWYWSKENKPWGDHALQAYLAAKNRNLLRFSLLWDNASNRILNKEQFTSMVSYWIANYFNQGKFLKIDGKPAVTVFSQYWLHEDAKKFGMTIKQLLDIAQSMAIAAGHTGIYFSACTEGTPADEYWMSVAPGNGFDALSAYNYHRGPVFGGPSSVTYQELMDGYQDHWEWILSKSSLPYIVPATSGWNMKPWRPGGIPIAHDNSVSTPETFETHLVRARTFMDENPERTKKMAVICAWNEFGEGSYIEPTKYFQFKYLEKVKKVFDTP